MITINIIAAIAENNAIGYQNKLLYHLPNDLKHFKALTIGHTVIMGRRTFESLPKGALPNRRNIMLSHTKDLTIPGVEVFHSLEMALSTCQEDEKVFIIGGESIYKEALPIAKYLYLTHIHHIPEQADAFFPPIDLHNWILVATESHKPDEKHRQAYDFVTYLRK